MSMKDSMFVKRRLNKKSSSCNAAFLTYHTTISSCLPLLQSIIQFQFQFCILAVVALSDSQPAQAHPRDILFFFFFALSLPL